jgi:hypothetical protein
MSAPPSFASFPDLDIGPSNPPNVPRNIGHRKGDKKHEKKRDHDKGKKRKRPYDIDVENVDERHQVWHQNSDDERLKAEEDRQSGHATTTGRSGSPLLFYTDRKGDPMNVRYGGLHAGDVSKYHLVDREPNSHISP